MGSLHVLTYISCTRPHPRVGLESTTMERHLLVEPVTGQGVYEFVSKRWSCCNLFLLFLRRPFKNRSEFHQTSVMRQVIRSGLGMGNDQGEEAKHLSTFTAAAATLKSSKGCRMVMAKSLNLTTLKGKSSSM